MSISRRVFLAGGLGLAASGLASAACGAQTNETSVTTIFVKDMHCETCAKKIASKLYTLPGVTQVKTHVKKGTATITTRNAPPVSPKAAWEALESIKFEPIRIASPRGNFQKKPPF